MTTIYPIGYNYYQADEQIESLMNDPCTMIVDCRLNPWSDHKPQYRKLSLEQRYGKRYRLAGHVLGNRMHPSNKALGGKIEIEIMDPDEGIRGLIYYLKRGHDLILLCQCHDYEHCHLKEIVKLLQEAMPSVEVVLQEPPPQTPEPSTGLKHLPPGAKVFAEIKAGQKVPAIVLQTEPGTRTYYLAWLRVAQQNGFSGEWLVSDLPKPVSSKKLKKRGTHIPELDDVPVAKEAI